MSRYYDVHKELSNPNSSLARVADSLRKCPRSGGSVSGGMDAGAQSQDFKYYNSDQVKKDIAASKKERKLFIEWRKKHMPHVGAETWAFIKAKLPLQGSRAEVSREAYAEKKEAWLSWVSSNKLVLGRLGVSMVMTEEITRTFFVYPGDQLEGEEEHHSVVRRVPRSPVQRVEPEQVGRSEPTEQSVPQPAYIPQAQVVVSDDAKFESLGGLAGIALSGFALGVLIDSCFSSPEGFSVKSLALVALAAVATILSTAVSTRGICSWRRQSLFAEQGQAQAQCAGPQA